VTDLGSFRHRIDGIDQRLVALLGERMRICEDVARHKAAAGILVVQPERAAGVVERCAEMGAANGLRAGFVRRLYELVIAETCEREQELLDELRAAGPAG
jgi:4-amino-4-deoxychorismate mutase